VAVAVYAVGQISGAHLNPAVTLALAFQGAFPWMDVPGYIATQLLGAMAGAVIVVLHYLPHWKETEDAATKLSEMIGTFIR
jgi:glycerol uptake facilitator protein